MGFVQRVPAEPSPPAHTACPLPDGEHGAGSVWDCDICGTRWVYDPYGLDGYRLDTTVEAVAWFLFSVPLLLLPMLMLNRQLTGWRRPNYLRTQRIVLLTIFAIIAVLVGVGVWGVRS